MQGPRLTWLLLGLALLSLPGCCMLGFGCCAIEVDFELAGGDKDAWRQNRITVVTALVADSEEGWVGPFETRSELASWIADRGLDSDQERHKQQLTAAGRLVQSELLVDRRRGEGEVQWTASLELDDVEAFQGKLLVFVNYRGDDPKGFAFETGLTEACKYGVLLEASGKLVDRGDEARLR